LGLFLKKFESIKGLSDEEFRRLTGVKRKAFEAMMGVLREAERVKKSRGGCPAKLSVEDWLLMALEYRREDRTYFHIGTSYGVSESSCIRSTQWIEDVLIKSGVLSLPGKKALLKSEMGYEVVLVDATESLVERPKKNRNPVILAKRNDTL
jgi:hypothetical protein